MEEVKKMPGIMGQGKRDVSTHFIITAVMQVWCVYMADALPTPHRITSHICPDHTIPYYTIHTA
jgi:hypothetical protein